jgi:hypothetical protein
LIEIPSHAPPKISLSFRFKGANGLLFEMDRTKVMRRYSIALFDDSLYLFVSKPFPSLSEEDRMEMNNESTDEQKQIEDLDLNLLPNQNEEMFVIVYKIEISQAASVWKFISVIFEPEKTPIVCIEGNVMDVTKCDHQLPNGIVSEIQSTISKGFLPTYDLNGQVRDVILIGKSTLYNSEMNFTNSAKSCEYWLHLKCEDVRELYRTFGGPVVMLDPLYPIFTANTLILNFLNSEFYISHLNRNQKEQFVMV